MEINDWVYAPTGQLLASKHSFGHVIQLITGAYRLIGIHIHGLVARFN